MAEKEIVMTEAEAAAAEALRVEMSNMTGTQRAAVLTLLLGEQQASEIIKFLDPKEVQLLGGAMVSVSDVSQEAVNVILDDFVAPSKSNRIWAWAPPTMSKKCSNALWVTTKPHPF